MSLDHTKFFVKRQNATLDAFLGGRLVLCQPEKGFRAGSDSVLLGASVPTSARRVLDLGAGVGAAGLVAALWAGDAEVFLAERDEEALALARDNVERNGLSARAHIIPVDVTAGGPEREARGIVSNSFDVVIANPPYFREGRGTPSGDAGRNAARHAGNDGITLWVRAAAAAAAARGEAIFVLPAARLGDALAAFEGRFGGVRILPIAARPGSEAKRVLIRGGKGSRAGLRLLAPLVLHGPSGNSFAPENADILMGRTKLDW
jgi:tRNA1(Val) A37 N6-methylase TrmN6